MAAYDPQSTERTDRLAVLDQQFVCPTILEEEDSDGDWPCEVHAALDDDDDLIDQEMDRLRHAVKEAECSLKSPRPHVRLQYNDEGLRDRFCTNAKRLLGSLEDPDTQSVSAQIARKALRYRNITNRLGEINPHDPAFDVSKFFGVKWSRTSACVSDN